MYINTHTYICMTHIHMCVYMYVCMYMYMYMYITSWRVKTGGASVGRVTDEERGRI